MAARRFHAGEYVAELVEAGTLYLRLSEQLDGMMVVTDEAVISLLRSAKGTL